MKQLLFIKFLRLLEKLTGKKIVYFPQDRAARNLTAVKSDLGFWYAGNVFDTSDIAYGVLYNGLVEKQGSFLVKNVIGYLLGKKERLVFYDIGANTGYFGVLAAFLGRPGRIFTYSFEPVKEFNAVELETLKLNNLEGCCEIFNLALGDQEGQADIFLAGSGTSLSQDFLGRRNLPSRKVLVKRLDDLVKEKNLQFPDFIKIDVEGHEFSVLKGAGDLLKKIKPVIWYESAQTIKANHFSSNDFFQTQNLLKDLGYEIFWCGPSLVKASGTVPDGVAMYLALHRQAHQELLGELEKLYAAN